MDENTDDAYVVKEIAAGTFANQIGLTSISIPVTVERIGTGVFNGCTVLAEISVDEDNPWYASAKGVLYDKDRAKLVACPARTEVVTLPAALTEIGEEAFATCHRLASLEIPASVETIGARAFLGCTRLSSISFAGNAPTATADIIQGANPSLVFTKKDGSTGWDTAPWNGFNVQTAEAGQPSGIVSASFGNIIWRYRVINGEAEIYGGGSAAIPISTVQTSSYDPDTFMWIPDGKLVIPSSLGGYPVTHIGNYAFSGCSALTEVVIPQTIRHIGDYAFANCTGITDLTLPSGVQSIGYHPFSGSAITSLALPDSLRKLDGNPLAGCDTILSVSLSADNSYYAVVNGILYNKDVAVLVGCPARKESVSIASTATRIGPEAFDGCFRLRAILLPEALDSVGTKAFRGTIRLSSIVFPASVTRLEGAGLFEGCTSLEFVGFAGNAPAVDPAIFAGTQGTLSIYVSQGTTGWKDATPALPDSGTWPTADANGRAIANLDVSAEAELKEGDIFVGITTNGTDQYAYTLKVLANKGIEILGISPKPIGSFNVPSDFGSSLGTLTVKSLGPQLFANAIGLLSVTVPNAVTNIGNEVFKNCSSLETVTLAHGLRVIGRHPFAGTAIEKITLPDTVSTIDGNPIYGCDPSVSISVGANNPYFSVSSEGALYSRDFSTLFACPMMTESITIPAATTNIASEAFAGCMLLKSAFFEGDAPEAADGDDLYVECHDSLTNFVQYGIESFGAVPGTWHLRPVLRYGEEPPEESDILTSADGKWRYRLLGDGTAEIWNNGHCAYIGESPAGSLQVPSTLDGHVVSAIGDGALANFAAVTSVSIPFSVTAIGEDVFTNCTLLAEFSVDSGNLRFSTDGSTLFNYQKTEIIAAGRNLESFTAPATVGKIRAHAFDGCSLLVSATFGAAIDEIGDGAFRGCSSLETVTFDGDAPTTAADDIYAGTPTGLETIVEPDATGWGTLPGTWKDRAIRARDAGEVHGDIYTDGTWYWVVQNGVAIIYNNGDCALVNPNTSGDVQVPSEVTDKDTHESFTVAALGRRALYGCKFVATITLPETIESIGEEAFSGTRISTLNIPAYVDTIYGNPAAGCARFTNFTVDEVNIDFFADANGLLYDYFCEELIGVPARATAVVIPESIINIRADAFDSCKVLTNATYLCDAPTLGSDDIYEDTSATKFKMYVAAGTTGWDGTSTTNMPTSGLWPTASATARPIISLYKPANEGETPPEDILSETDSNGLTWYYRVIDGVVEIWRNGETAVTTEDPPIMSVALPETLGGYVVKGLGDGALSNLRGITDISIPNTYEWIGDFTFSNCTSLASANLGEGVGEIGRWPFFGTKITELEIPDSVETIDGNPVAGASLARQVTVSGAQPYFSVVDGVLYDKDITTMLACPATKDTITIPETMTNITDDALYGCHVTFIGEATDGGITWTYEIVNGKAVITGASGTSPTVTIPNTLGGAPVDKVEVDALNALTNVSNYASLSAAYTARNGVLYSANGTHLVRIPDTMTLPYTVIATASNKKVTVTTIPRASADGGNVDRTSITTNTTVISNSCLTNNVNGDISIDVLLANVVVIDDYAFTGCNIPTNTMTKTSETVPSESEVGFTANDEVYNKTVTLVSTVSSNYTSAISLPASVLKVCDNAFEGSNITILGDIPTVEVSDYPYSIDIPTYSADAAVDQAVELLPLESPTPTIVNDADYRSYFKVSAAEKPGAPGTYTVTAELDESAIEFAKSQNDVGAAIADVSSGATDEATISAKPGLWYAIASSSTLNGPFEIVNCRLATGETVTLTMNRPSSESGYYRLIVDIVEITTCP